jgi:hypothetical protein
MDTVGWLFAERERENLSTGTAAVGIVRSIEC